METIKEHLDKDRFKEAEALFQEIQTISDQRSAALYMALPSASQELLRRNFDGHTLGRIAHGFWGVIHDEHAQEMARVRDGFLELQKATTALDEAHAKKAPPEEIQRLRTLRKDIIDWLTQILQKHLDEYDFLLGSEYGDFPRSEENRQTTSWGDFTAQIDAYKKRLKPQRDAVDKSLKELRGPQSVLNDEGADFSSTANIFAAAEYARAKDDYRCFQYPQSTATPDRRQEDVVNFVTVMHYKAIRSIFQGDLAADKLESFQESFKGAEGLREGLGVGLHDLSGNVDVESASVPTFKLDDDKYPAYHGAFAELEDTLQRRPERRVFGVCLTTEQAKTHFLQTLTRRFRDSRAFALRSQKLIYINFAEYFSNPDSRGFDLEKAKKLLDQAQQAGRVVLVLDLDGFQDENKALLEGLLTHWKNMDTGNRPALISLATEQTQETLLNDLSNYCDVFGKPQPLRSPEADQALFQDQITRIEEYSAVTFVPEDLDKLRTHFQSRVPFDPLSITLRVCQEAAAAVHNIASSAAGGEGRVEWQNLQKALETLPSVEHLPLEMRFHAVKGKMPPAALARAREELNRLKQTPEYSLQREKISEFLEYYLAFHGLDAMPLLIPGYETLTPGERQKRKQEVIQNAVQTLDESHYGMDEAKESIVLHLANQIQNEIVHAKNTGKKLLLVAPPGVGKTTLTRAIALALGRQYICIPLGGVDDESDIRGFSRTYSNSKPGPIVQGILRAGTKYLVIALDEIEKMEKRRGDPAQAVSDLLDGSKQFSDNYLGDIDVSEIIFVATANTIPPDFPSHLYDRFDVLHLTGYTREEKVVIGGDYVLEDLIGIDEMGITPDQVVIPDVNALLRQVVEDYTHEAGVRELIRLLSRLLKNALKEYWSDDKHKVVTLGADKVRDILGKPLNRPELGEEPSVGSAVISTTYGDVCRLRATLVPAPGSAFHAATAGEWGKTTQEHVLLAADVAMKHLPEWSKWLCPETPLSPELFNGQQLLFHLVNPLAEDDATKGLPALIAAVSRLTNRDVRPDVAFIGELNKDATVRPLIDLATHKKELQLEQRIMHARGIVKTVVVPAGNRQDLLDSVFSRKAAFRGAVHDMQKHRLLLPLLTPPAKAETRVRAAIEQWNAFVEKTTQKPPTGLIPEKRYSDKKGEWVPFSGSSAVIEEIFERLPSIPNGLNYVLLDQAEQALALAFKPLAAEPTGKSDKKNDGAANPSGKPGGHATIKSAAKTAKAEPPLVESIPSPLNWFEAIFKIGKETVDLREAILEKTGFDQHMRNIVKLLVEAHSYHTKTDDAKARVYLDAIEHYFGLLIVNDPLRAGELFGEVYGMIKSPETSEIIRFLVLHLSIVGPLLHTGDRQYFVVRKAKYESEVELLKQNTPVLNQRMDQGELLLKLDAFLAVIEKNITAIKPLENTAASGQLEEFALSATFRRIKDFRQTLGGLSDKVSRGECIIELNSAINLFVEQHKALALSFAQPVISSQPDNKRDRVESIVGWAMHGISKYIVEALANDPGGMQTINPAWNAYNAGKKLLRHISSKALVDHTLYSARRAPDTDLSQTYSAATWEVQRAVSQRNRRAQVLVVPSDIIKGFIPPLIAERLIHSGTPRRVLSVDFNMLSEDPETARKQMLDIVSQAQRAGNCLLVIDLDRFYAKLKESKFSAMNDLLALWSGDNGLLPIVFLSKEEVSLEYSENVPSYFNNAATHTVQFSDPSTLLSQQTKAIKLFTGIDVDDDVISLLVNMVGNKTIDSALAAAVLDEAADQMGKTGAKRISAKFITTAFIESVRHPYEEKLSPEERYKQQIHRLPLGPRRAALRVLNRFIKARQRNISSEEESSRTKLEHLCKFHGLKSSRVFLDELTGLTPEERAEEIKSVALTVFKGAHQAMDASHYGMKSIKDEAMDYLALLIQLEAKNLSNSGFMGILVVGDPGTGKTSFGKKLAEAVGRKFGSIAMGGASDPSLIYGHSETYVDSRPGKIVQLMEELGVNNPVINLDEIDKLIKGAHGNVADALLQATDPEFNGAFVDHYMGEVDISRVLFYATANNLEDVPGPLRDRFIVIRLPGYDEDDKVHIGVEYILKQAMGPDNLGITNEISIPNPEALVRQVVRGYIHTPGVRGLERVLLQLLRKALLEHFETGKTVTLTPEDVPKYLGLPSTGDKTRDQPELGCVNGLAVGPEGGMLMDIQADIYDTQMRDKPLELVLRGNASDDMQSSCQQAFKHILKSLERWGFTPEHFNGKRIFVTIYPGDIPKAGPSAGVGFAAVLASVLLGKLVRQDMAMTGQVNADGEVLAIGGVDKKASAARKAGATGMFLPYQNRKELLEAFVKGSCPLGVIEENERQSLYIRKQRAREGYSISDADRAMINEHHRILETAVSRALGTTFSQTDDEFKVEGPRGTMQILLAQAVKTTALSQNQTLKDYFGSTMTYILVSHVEDVLTQALVDQPANAESGQGDAG